MAQRYVGVDLGTHHVKVVVITSGLRGAQVLAVHEEPVEVGPEGDDSVEAAVAVAAAVLKSRRLTHEPIGVALPGRYASYRVLDFPFADSRRIAQAIPFETEGQFPVALERLRYDHLVVQAPGHGGRALVVAVPDERVAAVGETLRQHEIVPRVVTVGGMALAQALSPDIPPLVEVGDEPLMPVALVVDIGHRATELVALGPKGPLAARTIRTGGKAVTVAIARAWGFDLEAAEAAKIRDAFVPHRGHVDISREQIEAGRIVAEAVEPLVRELEHTRLWLRTSYGCVVTKMILAGGGSRLNGLGEYLAEHTGLPVERAAPVEGKGLTGLAGKEWDAAALALGVALATARRPLVQLQHAPTGTGDPGWLQDRIASMVAIGVAIMAFGALDTIAQVKALEAEREAYATELRTASEKVFGTAVTDPADIEKRLQAVQGQDLTSMVPIRGAVEVLAMISEVAAPHAPEQAEPDGSVDEGSDGGAAAVADGEAAGGEEGIEGGQGAPRSVLKPISDPSKGISPDDELAFGTVDIRERKVEIQASATRSSAQDRLAMKLQTLGCLTNLSKGKVRDQNERKVFAMSMDNTCYVTRPAREGEE